MGHAEDPAVSTRRVLQAPVMRPEPFPILPFMDAFDEPYLSVEHPPVQVVERRGRHMRPEVIGPPTDNRIELKKEHFQWQVKASPPQAPKFLLDLLHRFLAGRDQQFPAAHCAAVSVVTDIETQPKKSDQLS